jgi:hypothetical protein
MIPVVGQEEIRKLTVSVSGNAENRKLKVSPTDIAENGNLMVTIEDHAENRKPAPHKAKNQKTNLLCRRSC